MTEQEREILQKVKALAADFFNNPELVLFGSRARGDFSENSDWDLLILVEEAVDVNRRTKFSAELFKLGHDHQMFFQTVFKTRSVWDDQKRFPLRIEVERDGIVL